MSRIKSTKEAVIWAIIFTWLCYVFFVPDHAQAYDDEPDTFTAYYSHEVETDDYILCYYDSYRGTIVVSIETWDSCPMTIEVPR